MGERCPGGHPSEPTPRIDTTVLREICDRLRNVDHFKLDSEADSPPHRGRG